MHSDLLGYALPEPPLPPVIASSLPSAATPRTRWQSLCLVVATGGGLGFLRPAPGTWASLAACALAYAALCIGCDVRGFLVAAIAAYVLGLITVPAACRVLQRGDPAPVVIDEIAACWFTIAFALAALPGLEAQPLRLCALACFAFRAFDIIKPWPVHLAERLPGAAGVMADDLVAAVLAGLVITIGLG